MKSAQTHNNSTSYLPFLVNRGSIGNTPIQNVDIPNFPERRQNVNHNQKRSSVISSLKRKNYELSGKIQSLMLNMPLTEVQDNYLLKLDKNLRLCATHSLYREHNNGAYDYVGSHTCDNKLCHICNHKSQKSVRRKYANFFENNPRLTIVRNTKTKRTQALTHSVWDKWQADEKKKETYIKLGEETYDLMHLTLTVPHFKDTGFRGFELYYEQIIKIFNHFRKNRTWQKKVFGGEYGIETTNTKNGLNIHIHALLLVKKERQSRNNLHQYILKYWNKNTGNPYSPRKTFNNKTREAIMKSNSLIDHAFINQLDPQGTTLIGLENIYDKQSGKKSGYDAKMAAVMETISYHFEPQCFSKEEGQYDIDLMLKVMPEIHGKPLHQKFGALYYEQSLNVRAPKESQLVEDYEDSGGDIIINPITLQESSENQYRFFITNPSNVWHDTDDNHKLVVSKQGIKIYMDDTADTAAALMKMMHVNLGAMFRDKKQTSPFDNASPAVKEWFAIPKTKTYVKNASNKTLIDSYDKQFEELNYGVIPDVSSWGKYP